MGRAAPQATSSAAAAPIETSDVSSREHRPASGPAPVIWLGLDGLDWELLDRLVSEGRMPNWKRLTAEGFSAKLQSFYPILSPLLWTTAATGLPPAGHGVLDFQEADPKTGHKVPISGFSRSVPAVWNLASAAGRKVGVVGWWATHPAEEVNGFFVSDHASPILFSSPSLAGTAYPASLVSGLEQIVRTDGRVTEGDLAPYLGIPPSEIALALGSGSGKGLEDPVVALSRILGATRVTQRIARGLYDRDRPDLTAVYFEGTDEVAHVFASFAPPRLSCISDSDATRYGRAVETYYSTMDRVLGQWMRRAEEDGATLLVHSDHGFKWGIDRPCGFASGDWSTAAFWHRLEGVFAAWGARVRPRIERKAVRIFDVAPTVLALLGLPAGRGMTGRATSEAFDRFPPALQRENLQRIEVRRVSAEATTAGQADEYAKKLLALGYLSQAETAPLEPPGGERPGRTEGAWNNLGMYRLETEKNPASARAAFVKSLELRPGYYSPMFNLARLERAAGNLMAAEDWLFRSLAAVRSDPAPALRGWAVEYERQGRHAAATALMERAAGVFSGNEEIARHLGLLRFRRKDCRGAVAALAAFDSTTRDPRTLNTLALFQTCLQNRGEVVRLLERSLAVKPDQPEVARSLATARGRPLS